MRVKPDENIARRFELLIADPNRNENDVQSFLEEHTEFLPPSWFQNHPMAMNAIIAKFPIGGRIADFAYLMSDSATWYLVLVELESPHKPLFASSSNHHKTSAKFDDALHQMHVWAEFFESYPEQVRELIRPMLVPPNRARNIIRLRRVLIIGRSSDYESHEARTRRISTLSEDHKIKILTYDSLLRHYRAGLDEKRCVLSPRGAGMAIKRMDAFPQRTFAYLTPEQLHVPKHFVANLKAAGYQMEKWLANEPLLFNDKWATKPEGYDDEEIAGRMIDAAVRSMKKGRARRAKRQDNRD